MKIHAFFIIIFVLSIAAPQSGLTAASTAGKFKATMGDKIYDLDVTCDRFSKNEVMFRSDDDYSGGKDTNGDNIAVYGQPGSGEGLGLVLEIYDNGKTFLLDSDSAIKRQNVEFQETHLQGKEECLILNLLIQ